MIREFHAAVTLRGASSDPHRCPQATRAAKGMTMQTILRLRRRRRLSRLAAAVLLAGAVAVAAAAPVTRDDRLVIAVNGDPVSVPVIANDLVDAGALADGELRISSPPQGEAIVDTRGTVDASDDRIAYAPPADFSGDDVLSYQVCEEGDVCGEGQLHIVVRPLVDPGIDSGTGAGFVDERLQRQPDLPDVMFRTTPLAWPQVDTLPLAVDATPADPWDGDLDGAALVVRTLPAPADGLPKRWRVLVDAQGAAGDVDVYLGVDANGDSLPDPGEVQCTGAMSVTVERCELAVTHPGNAPVRWWMVVHNRHGAAQDARAEAFEVMLDEAGDGTLTATGPGDVPEDLPFDLRLAWTDPTVIGGESRLGYVRVVSAGLESGLFPVRIDRTTDAAPATLLGSAPLTLRLAPATDHDRIFFDVPAGATQLRVIGNSGGNIDLHVSRALATPSPDVGAAPAVGAEQGGVSAGPTGVESVTVDGAALVPGRWFVRVRNRDPVPALATVQTFIAAQAPVVRPGSYFNPGRSGHGTFLYPAADQRTGLWYTYFQDRSPTWYYLQAPQPGATGIWSSELYRAAWDGDSRELVDVGRVVLTPVAADVFTWSYEIDGEAGSETFSALGRGCPTLDGDVVDASSTWFDPDHAGTGYSVQYFPDYEFYAAFVYDTLGVPRFIISERTSFGSADELIDLEQLRGFCPLCERTGDPERDTIGVFGRGFSSDAVLEMMAAAGIFTGNVDGTWSQEDDVQLLGGPGTTQGCAL